MKTLLLIGLILSLHLMCCDGGERTAVGSWKIIALQPVSDEDSVKNPRMLAALLASVYAEGELLPRRLRKTCDSIAIYGSEGELLNSARYRVDGKIGEVRKLILDDSLPATFGFVDTVGFFEVRGVRYVLEKEGQTH